MLCLLEAQLRDQHFLLEKNKEMLFSNSVRDTMIYVYIGNDYVIFRNIV